MISPPPLKKGDKIAIAAPARKISLKELAYGIQLIEDQGYQVVYHDSIFAEINQFAGDDELRAKSLQQWLDDPSIKAIFFARGGYGSVRIIDLLDFSGFVAHPKWLVGYSDMTVFHSHVVELFNIQTLHAPMPFGFENNTPKAFQSLFDALSGNPKSIEWTAQQLSRKGEIAAPIVGGNLSVLYSLLGSRSFPQTDGKILFIEDLDEYLYHIDRMMMGLKRAGKFDHLAGLIVGGMSDMRDNAIPFGKTAEEIIWDAVKDCDYPVAFGCPVGHIPDNQTLVMGKKIELLIEDDETTIQQ
jgi:muramoyltetrapeptide carboxypeptidase